MQQLHLLNNKEITISQLMKHVPGPDFPTGGIIIGKDILKTRLQQRQRII